MAVASVTAVGLPSALNRRANAVPASASAAPSPSPSKTAPPLSPAAYQQVLAGVDEKLTPALAAVGTAGNMTLLGTAATALRQVLGEQIDRLAALAPPPAALAAHKRFVLALNGFMTDVLNLNDQAAEEKSPNPSTDTATDPQTE